MSHPRQLNAKNNLTEAPSLGESNYGKVISVRGSVVDVRFEQGRKTQTSSSIKRR